MTWDEKWLQQNGKRKDVRVLPSGLQYKVTTRGQGPKPYLDCNVDLHSKGYLVSDGTEFENTYKSRRPKLKVPVFKLIKGLSEALVLMTEGSKWEIFLPSDLAFGQKRVGRYIRPGMALHYHIELLKVHPPPPLTAMRRVAPWAQARESGIGVLHIAEADLPKFRERVPKFLALFHQTSAPSKDVLATANTFIRTAELVLERPRLPAMVAVLAPRKLRTLRVFTPDAPSHGERFKGGSDPESILMFLQHQAMGLHVSPQGGSAATDMFSKHVTTLRNRDFDEFERRHRKMLLLVHSNPLHPTIKETFARAAAKVKYLAKVFAVEIEDRSLCSRLRIRNGVTNPLLYLRLPHDTIKLEVDLSKPAGFSERRLMDAMFLHVVDSREL